MAKRENNDLAEELPEELEAKIERRDKRKKPKMKVSGKRVFQLKQIFKKRR